MRFWQPTQAAPIRLNCVAMVDFAQGKGWAAFSLLILLAATAAVGQRGQNSQRGGQDTQPAQSTPSQSGSGQSSKPLPLQPGVPGMGKNHRLILKDGSYQMVRDYQIVGERVRYLSRSAATGKSCPRTWWTGTRRANGNKNMPSW